MTPVLLTNIARPCLYDFMRCNYVNAIVSYFPWKKAEKTKLLIKLVCVSSAVQVSYPKKFVESPARTILLLLLRQNFRAVGD